MGFFDFFKKKKNTSNVTTSNPDRNTSNVIVSATKKNPALRTCPYCKNHLFREANSCEKCGKDFSEVKYVEFKNNDTDNISIINKVNELLSDNNKDILDIKISTCRVTINSNGRKWKDSLVDSIIVYYVTLENDRDYKCKLEQIAKYKKINTDSEVDQLTNNWAKNLSARRSVTNAFQYQLGNGVKGVDIFGWYWANLDAPPSLDTSMYESEIDSLL